MGPFPYIGDQNPTLIPNFSANVGSNGRGLVKQSPAAFLAANPRADGTLSITVGGTITADDTLTVSVANSIFSNPKLGVSSNTVSVTYEVKSGDTVDTIAEALAGLLNDDATLGYYMRADASAAVIEITWSGPISGFTTASTSKSSGATETLTLSPSDGVPSGGSGPVLVWANFKWTARGQVRDFMMGNFYRMDGMLARMVATGQPIQ